MVDYYLKILKDLNPSQKQAVLNLAGPNLIIAGAGAGKTKTLTYKVAYLIANKINPYSIVVLTFTNKAALEMKDRIQKLLKTKRLPFIGTFHSFALNILRNEAKILGYQKNFSIFDEEESIALIKKAINNLNLANLNYSANNIYKIFSFYKNKGTDNESYLPASLKVIYLEYEKLLKEHNAFDFDNLILKALEIFKKHPEVLEKYQKKYSYFLIDEFQDTNSPQYQLIKLLASENKNITVVGDDWQSIYSFRSADYRILLNFQKDWPQAKIFFLEQNYRSTQNILDASYSVISKNIFRTDKKLFTTNGKGELIKVLKFKDEREEALWIKERIVKELKNGGNLNDFAILFRTNVQSRVFEDLLISEKIPYQLIGAFKFYQRKEIQDIVSYLKYLYNPNDKVSLERIINIPRRKIGESTIKILKDNNWNFETLKNKPVFKQLKEFNLLIKKLESALKELPMSSFLTFLIDSLNYKDYLNISTEEGLERWQNIKELIGIAYNFDSFSPKEGFENFLESISLLEEADNFDKNANKLTLMTLHSAKGLEFPVVFIPGVEESLIPHEKSLYNQESLEEERRLFYVGMTRAKKELYLTCTEERFLNGEYRHNEPSRFLDEIDESLKENFDNTVVKSDYEEKIEYF